MIVLTNVLKVNHAHDVITIVDKNTFHIMRKTSILQHFERARQAISSKTRSNNSENYHNNDVMSVIFEDCKHVLHVPVPSYMPLDIEDFCNKIMFFYKANLEHYRELSDVFDAFNDSPRDFQMPKWWKGYFSFVNDRINCQEYVRKHVAIITIHSPRAVITKSKRVSMYFLYIIETRLITAT